MFKKNGFIWKQINTQIATINDLKVKRERLTKEIDSDISLAEEMLLFLESKMVNTENLGNERFDDILENNNSISPSVKKMTPPAVIDENVLKALSSNLRGLTNPEIRRFLETEHSIFISEPGIKASLERFIKNGKVELVDPEAKIRIKYRLIQKEEV